MARLFPFALMLAVSLSGCASRSKMMLGEARAPIDPTQVRVYRTPPPGAIDIAEIDASSNLGFGTRGQHDSVIDRLKREAAALGANGLLIVGSGSSGSSGGMSVGVGSYGSNVSGGIGLGIPTRQQRATAVAIYVPPASFGDATGEARDDD